MSLLELTVVILVLLSLAGMLFFGARAWKRGSDRAICIIQIQSVQKGVRSYSNLYNLVPGDTVPELKKEIIGPGKFMEATPSCPSNGIYSYGSASGIDIATTTPLPAAKPSALITIGAPSLSM